MYFFTAMEQLKSQVYSCSKVNNLSLKSDIHIAHILYSCFLILLLQNSGNQKKPRGDAKLEMSGNAYSCIVIFIFIIKSNFYPLHTVDR
jgi:hypothetical protein